ncbi:MAG: hypothetical protein KAX20_04190 [Candidatus Omnitrophica bacterium]|nr:hypothetical protein [Candidatus Omnitrophota bacterium]
MKRKRIWWFFIGFVVLLLLFSLPHSPRRLINVEKGIEAKSVCLIIPLSAEIFAPFLDFPFYFFNLSEPKLQLSSWLIWLLAIWLIFALIRLKGPVFKKIVRLFRGIIVVIVSFLLFVLYLLLFPLPEYRLKSEDPNEILLDLHSHTIYSHDGIATLERSVLWHLNCGFNGWATTEHSWIGAAPIAQGEMLEKNSLDALVIAGEEVNFKGSHLNLLGIKEDIDKGQYKDLADLIRVVHRQKGVVIVPHYWGKRRPPLSLEDLAKAGVDGFEIAGASSRPLRPELRKEIINLCKKKNLVMVGGSNWHGWGSFCNVWTGFKVDNWERLDKRAREKVILDALRRRENSRFRVIALPKKFYSEYHYIFEPFIGTFSYFCSLNNWQRVSWFLWVVMSCFLLRSIKDKRRIAIFLWLVISLILVVKGISLLNTWQLVATVNEILPTVSKGLFLLAAVTMGLAISDVKK